MSTTQSNETFEAIHQLHDQFNSALRSQAEQIGKLDQGLKSLQNEQQRLEEVAAHLIEPLENTLANGEKPAALSPSGILSSVRKLAGAAYAEQVFASLAEEAARMKVRSAVFDVRGRAAWGCSACGFEPELSGEALRTLVIPLNHEGPFRQAFETGEAVEARAESLARDRNIMATLGPVVNAHVLLVPVRSAGSVMAIFYAETGERRDSILTDSLKVLAEFAGAQIDRLVAMNGGLAGVETVPKQEQTATVSTPVEETLESKVEAEGREAAFRPATSEVVAPEADPAEETIAAVLEEAPASSTPAETAEPASQNQAATEAPAAAPLSEEEQKIHRDAQRFSRLLVTEIELYNKNGVEEGRKNRDLYLRLKKDIDRSRETYEKRFANTVASQVDYFHEEVVRRLAENDPALLGVGYTGSSV